MLNQLVQQRKSSTRMQVVRTNYRRFTEVNVGITAKGGAIIDGILQCTQILNIDHTHKQQRFWQSMVHLHKDYV